jgi:hypothetical protein
MKKESQQDVSRILSPPPRALARQRPFLFPRHHWRDPATDPEAPDGPSGPGCGCLPIWSCSVRGFACHLCYHRRGALLPHLFTLTREKGAWNDPSLARRYVFCATVLQVTLTGRYPAHCPTEFGLSSPPSRFRAPTRRPSALLRRIDSNLIRGASPPPVARLAGPRTAMLGRRALPAASRLIPVKSDTARASCRGCCAACR